MLELESELPNLEDGDRDAWQAYLGKEMDVRPRWVWNVDLEGMLSQAKDLFEHMKQDGESAVEV